MAHLLELFPLFNLPEAKVKQFTFLQWLYRCTSQVALTSPLLRVYRPDQPKAAKGKRHLYAPFLVGSDYQVVISLITQGFASRQSRNVNTDKTS